MVWYGSSLSSKAAPDVNQNFEFDKESILRLSLTID